MPTPLTRPLAIAGALLLAACARGPRPAAPTPDPDAPVGAGLPPVPRVTGPLDVRVQWPPAGNALAGRDSTFVFGSVGSGDARLTVNGVPVEVAPNGAFLGFVPVPPASAPRFEFVAARGADTARRTVAVRVGGARRALPADGPLVVDSGSVAPTGRRVLRPDETVRVSVRAPRNAGVWLQLPPGEEFIAATPGSGAEGRRVAGRRYVLVDANAARGAAGGGAAATSADAGTLWVLDVRADHLRSRPDERAQLVVGRGRDTVRLAIGRVETLATADSIPGSRQYVQLGRPGAVPDSDRVVVGRPSPDGTYKWFFAPGTIVEATGAIGDWTRVRLDHALEVWVARADATPLPEGYAPPPRLVGGARLTPTAESVDLLLPMAGPAPYEVVERGREVDLILYGTVVSPEILPIIGNDTLVRQVVWRQEASDRARITLRLSRDPFGYQVLWDPARGALVMRVRRPPAVDPARPLAGLTLVVDAGHPPGGATGPTGLTEAQAVLPVAERVRALLAARGANVVMTRTTPEAVALAERPVIARRANAHAFLSVHLNAFPDGVNPFTQAGTSTLFFHQHSEPLARLVQREMVRRFQLRDLGVHYQNLAVARPSWYPAVLTEGLFLMFPQQEAAMRSREGVELYAEAIVAGVERYFRELAAGR